MSASNEIRGLLTKLKARLVAGEIDRAEYDDLRAAILADLTPEEQVALGATTPSPQPASGSGSKLGPKGGVGGGLRTAIPSLSDLDLSPGTVLFDQWRIVRELGRGGFGTVFEAEELHLNQIQAVKVLDPTMVAKEELLGRFRREVSLMRQLVHPHIVRVYDYREDLEQHLALTSMEHVAGGSVAALRDLAKKGGEPVPIPLALAILFQAMEALAEAHSRGVIHRDVTPGNILLSGGTPEELIAAPRTDPGVKLVDFGIAGLVDRSELSQKSRVLGTAAYVAPEVLDPEVAISPAADAYGAGAVVYELVTGELPLGRFDTPSELREELPEDFDGLLMGLLERRPQRRTTSAVAVELAISVANIFSGSVIEISDGRVEEEPEPESPKQGQTAEVVDGSGGNYQLVAITGVGPSSGDRKPGDVWVEPVLGMRFRRIPAGTFLMGSPVGEGMEDETLHQVMLTRGFWMGETPVTQGQWRRLMRDNPSHFSSNGDDCPVENVNWYDALRFANELSNRGGSAPCYSFGKKSATFSGLSSSGFRLPTEAEWEYAARAGAPGGLYPADLGERALDAMAWGGESKTSSTGPQSVRTKRANAWGLHDTYGNVWEWVWDYYGDYPSRSVTDPVGPSRHTGRVIRGYCWMHPLAAIRAAARHSQEPINSELYTGFRLARTVSNASGDEDEVFVFFCPPAYREPGDDCGRELDPLDSILDIEFDDAEE